MTLTWIPDSVFLAQAESFEALRPDLISRRILARADHFRDRSTNSVCPRTEKNIPGAWWRNARVENGQFIFAVDVFPIYDALVDWIAIGLEFADTAAEARWPARPEPEPAPPPEPASPYTPHLTRICSSAS